MQEVEPLVCSRIRRPGAVATQFHRDFLVRLGIFCRSRSRREGVVVVVVVVVAAAVVVASPERARQEIGSIISGPAKSSKNGSHWLDHDAQVMDQAVTNIWGISAELQSTGKTWLL